MPDTLTLARPLVALDLETTGLDVDSDRIVELACIKLWPDGRREELVFRCHPGRPIPAAASAVHGILDADVAQAAPFAERAAQVVAFLRDVDLTGFNVEKFDLPLLRQELRRAGHDFPPTGAAAPPCVVDSMHIFKRQEPRNLAAAYRFYCQQTLEKAHSAAADATAALEILQAQIRRYDSLPGEMAGLHAFCHPVPADAIDPEGKLIWVDGEAALGFGKHRRRTLAELCEREPDYLRWVASKDFPAAVIAIVRDALDGRFPRRGAP